MKTEYLVGGAALVLIIYLYASRTASTTPTYVNGVPVGNGGIGGSGITGANLASIIGSLASAGANIVHTVESQQTPTPTTASQTSTPAGTFNITGGGTSNTNLVQ